MQSGKYWGTVLLRAVLGGSFLFHGVSRFWSGLLPFVKEMEEKFGESPLPPFSIQGFSYVLPFVETTLGLLILFSVFKLQTLLATGLLLLFLITGTCLIGEWSTLPVQFIHVLLVYLLLTTEDTNGNGEIIAKETIAQETKLKEWYVIEQDHV